MTQRYLLTASFGLVLGMAAAGCTPRERQAEDGSEPSDASGLEGGVDAGETGAASGAGGVVGMPPQLELPEDPCNGNPGFCSRRYDEICFVATHHSAAGSREFWRHPAQNQTLREQLNRGIRALMFSVFDDGGVATVCRERCDEGRVPLGVVLADVATFFEENPRDVLTLLLDGELPAEHIADEFAQHGLDELARPHAAGDPWPTLQEMIDDGQRLVVLAGTPDPGPPWLLRRQSLLWETGSAWEGLLEMTCNPEVGEASRPLYLVHHDLVTPGNEEPMDATDAGARDPAEPAAEANQFAVVTQRLQRCLAQHGHAPSFVAVDYSQVGDPIGGAQVINGVREP